MKKESRSTDIRATTENPVLDAGIVAVKSMSDNRGYTGIGIYKSKFKTNIGTLVRSARAFGADFCFTIGKRYRGEVSSVGHDDHIPIFHFSEYEEMLRCSPDNCKVIGIEISGDSTSLEHFSHPERAVYLLGAEDEGIPQRIMDRIDIVSIPTDWCLNVSTAGSIALYDRKAKSLEGDAQTDAVEGILPITD